MTSFQNRLSILAMALWLTGCKANGPAQAGDAATNAAMSGTSQSDGPSAEDIQQRLVTELPRYIADHCKGDTKALLSSVPTIKFKVTRHTLANKVNGSYEVVQTAGNLLWPYRDKALKADPSVGSPIIFVMTNDATANPDHTDKWDFISKEPPYSLLLFNQDAHTGAVCE